MEKELVLVSLFAALIAALGLVPAIPLLNGVPITAQSLGIMLCGTILGARVGSLAALMFIGLTALGLPLLAGGRGGLGVFFSPTAGFVIGFPISAFITGWIMHKLRCLNTGISSTISAFSGGIFGLYIPGIIGLLIMTNDPLIAVGVGMLVYLPGDLIKVFLCAIITVALYKSRPQMVLTKSLQSAPDAAAQTAKNPPQKDEAR